MAGDIGLYVSKRLQRPAVAVLCLMTAQLLLSLAACHTERAPMAVRAPIAAN
jgi:hypothetical protein